jgi:hypothetical protein
MADLPIPSTKYPGRLFFHTATPTTLLEAGFDFIRVEKRQDHLGAWGTVSGTETELFLEAGRYNYHFLDPEAARTAEYRAVLVKRAGAPPAEVVQAGVMRAVDTAYDAIMSIKELKEIYLWGQDEGFIRSDGLYQPDYAFAHFLRFGVAKVEKKMNMFLLPRRQRELHDFTWQELGRAETLMLSVDCFPFLSIESIVLKRPGSDDVPVDLSYVQFEGDIGQIVVHAGAFGAMSSRPQPNTRVWLPMHLEVTYIAGFNPAAESLPADLIEAVGKEASFGPLNVGGDLIGGAGLAGISVSMDGLSQNVTTTNSSTNAGFGARLIQYQKELKDYYDEARNHYKGIGLRVA